MNVAARIQSPIGEIWALSNGRAVTHLYFEKTDVGFAEWSQSKAAQESEDAIVRQLGLELTEYFEGERTTFSVPIELKGTPFQKSVWKALVEIPYGQSVTYSQLADKLGHKNGQRAVGKANADNPVSLIVPCHRVIRADGDLCGYAGGLWRKQYLLGLETGQQALL